MSTVHLKWLTQRARAVGPYLLVEFLLPGGTLLALLLWLTQHGKLQPRNPLWQIRERSEPTALVHAAR